MINRIIISTSANFSQVKKEYLNKNYFTIHVDEENNKFFGPNTLFLKIPDYNENKQKMKEFIDKKDNTENDDSLLIYSNEDNVYQTYYCNWIKEYLGLENSNIIRCFTDKNKKD